MIIPARVFPLRRAGGRERAAEKQRCQTEKMRSRPCLRIVPARAYGAEAELRELQRHCRRVTLSWNMFQIRTNVFTAILNLMAEYAAYGYALFLLWSGGITCGTMTLFLQQRSALSGAFSGLASVVAGFVSSSASARRIQALIALPREKHQAGEIPPAYSHTGLTQKIDGVDFSYEDGKRVLEASDFEACPGQINALVGPGGEGKTTVFRLILGIIQPGGGECLFVPEACRRCRPAWKAGR